MAAWCLSYYGTMLVAATLAVGASPHHSSMREFNFPIFVRTGENVPVHNLNEDCFTQSVEKALYLEDLQVMCVNAASSEKYEYIELRTWNQTYWQICCTNATQNNKGTAYYPLRLKTPTRAAFNTPPQEGHTIVRVPRQDGSNSMSTLYKTTVRSDSDPQVEFWGCFDWSWTTDNNCGDSGCHDVFGYYSAVPNVPDHDNIERVHYVQFKYSVATRIWDMSHLCFERWVPWAEANGTFLVPKNSPIATPGIDVHDQIGGVALYYENYGSSALSWGELKPYKAAPMKMDKYHFLESRCVKSPLPEGLTSTETAKGSSHPCRNWCQQSGYEFAAITKKNSAKNNCTCFNSSQAYF